MVRELALHGRSREGGLNMKKLLIILTAVVVLVLSIYPVSAFADSRSVTALNVSCVKGQVSYSGTVASGVKAAAVLLFDPNGSLMMMDTCGVTSGGAFSGTMSANLTLAGAYSIKASDYEGGVFTEKTFSLYSITYYLNGGTNNEANPRVFLDESVNLLIPPQRISILGWYPKVRLNKGVRLERGETDDKKLYAKWRKFPYDKTRSQRDAFANGHARADNVADTNARTYSRVGHQGG
jgi:hypothetical protein